MEGHHEAHEGETIDFDQAMQEYFKAGNKLMMEVKGNVFEVHNVEEAVKVAKEARENE